MADKAEFHFFPTEIEQQIARFDRQPISIIQAFLACFDSAGTQKFEVPQHVLEALAARFRLLMDERHKVNSLDVAFGGRVAVQRNALREEEHRADVVFEHIVARQKAKKKKRPDRTGTPFEQATEYVAKARGMSEENVRKKYRRAGKS